MQKIFVAVLFFSLFGIINAFGQDLKTSIAGNKELDSLRKKEQMGKDSVVFTSKYIRYTTRKLTKDSIQTIPLDTTLTGIQNFSPIAQPRYPTVGTGLVGLAVTPLLFDPVKTIGFDAGFHSLDMYRFTHDDTKFYRARTPFTSLSYISAGDNVQLLKIIHSQNIKPNWNFGANFNRIGANGFYKRQRGDVLNGTLFTWYQTRNKRYNIWVDAVFNTMKAQENGSILKDTVIFSKGGNTLVSKVTEPVRLNSASQLYRYNSLMIRQSYFVGRIDSTTNSTTQNILPTNKVTHTFVYNNSSFSFKKDEEDLEGVFPSIAVSDLVFTNDTTNVKHIQNEFIYSFFLRAKNSSIIKNELKIDAGIRNDIYSFKQQVLQRDTSIFFGRNFSAQNTTLLGALGYRFSDKVDVNLNVQQIFQGRNAGDYLYEASSNFALNEKTGKIVMSVYTQNKSPEEIFNRYYGNHYQWDRRNDFSRTKTTNFSFAYINNFLKLDASASYYLISSYLYFLPSSTLDRAIVPEQFNGEISLLQFKVGKQVDAGSFHINAYGVYQKTDQQSLLRTPEIYLFASVYKDQTFFKVLKTQIGFDVFYNDSYLAKSYSIAASQFYNGDAVTFSSKPIVDAWVKVGLRRANLFAKYQYVNQGLLSGGYYTVNRYPMPDRLLTLGFTWNFYD
ncbi:putative porin [Pedobacter xixiisoli]|uniref:Porin n=1 Tax=Pedobacter xixiisoli TaxID=1476464 RepID=A0A286A0R9_9SPHI|nr:putative porin [Pedobacter xixiisoli]SOD15494.1 Putative porin [Pedobacter xixiisoli]